MQGVLLDFTVTVYTMKQRELFPYVVGVLSIVGVIGIIITAQFLADAIRDAYLPPSACVICRQGIISAAQNPGNV